MATELAPQAPCQAATHELLAGRSSRQRLSTGRWWTGGVALVEKKALVAENWNALNEGNSFSVVVVILDLKDRQFANFYNLSRVALFEVK